MVKRNGNIIASIDIGSSKICAIVAEFDGESGKYRLKGNGKVPSKGLRKGTVVDIIETREAMKSAMSKAQNESETTISHVLIGVGGDHINSLITHPGINLSYRDDPEAALPQVKQEDIDILMEKAQQINLDPGREILRVIPQFFQLDNETEILNPLGLSGNKLSLDAYIIHAATTNLENLRKSVLSTGLNIAGLMLNSLASASAVLTENQKDLGVMLIDIGGGTADVTVYKEGILVFTGSIGYGGAIITRDIAQIAQIAPDLAEDLKIRHAWATKNMAEANGITDIKVKNVSGEADVWFDSRDLSEYVEARIREIFYLVRQLIGQQVHIGSLRAGIVLTGGTAKLKGISELAEELFGIQAIIGYPKAVPGLEECGLGPEYATALGLLQFGKPSAKNLPIGSSKGKIGNIFVKVYKFVKEKLF
ncbi:MAG TPA: cell division protein FtsA [Candidatus Marinimicrobia bacterium]|nr:cell division protein FtsA [Candidatus Neomarinimicrobiota bacterium]